MAFADEALAGLEHRRMDVDLIDVATPLRAEFEERGWENSRIVYMSHELALPPGEHLPVDEVPYESVLELREAWNREDSPDHDPGDYPAQAQEVALLQGARVLAVQEDGGPVAFAQLEGSGTSAEITQVYVHPERRGRGLGTAITRAAIEAAGRLEDLWISADDEGRAKDLYARLGFSPAWTSMELTRLP